LTLPLSEKLTGLLGDGHIVSPQQLLEYAVDGLIPQAVVQPSSREAIAEVLRWAASEKLAVVPRGGGTQLSLGNLPQRVDLVLDLSKFNQLLDYQPADLTATVEAGITLEALQQGLAQGGKFAPLEAPLAQKATIGGILASNASGPLRYTYGLPRDWLIGISLVGPDGVETKAGGRVVKNVTGYDLNKLYTGSLGTLGVIVEATFKLAPVSPDSGALLATVPSLQKGIDASRNLLAQVFAPQGVQVINAEAAHHLPVPITISNNEAVVITFLTGRARAVQRRLDESTKLLQRSGAENLEHLEPGKAESLLRLITDLGWADDSSPQLRLKVSVPPSVVGKAVAWHQNIEPRAKIESMPGIVADPGFGGIRLLWWGDSNPGEGDSGTAVSAIHQVRKLAADQGGSVVVEHCPLSVKQQIDVWGESTELIELMRRIKHKFDPLRILNPGRFMGKL
jgi:glycolate oxidase FAD binding subunit